VKLGIAGNEIRVRRAGIGEDAVSLCFAWPAIFVAGCCVLLCFVGRRGSRLAKGLFAVL